MSEEIRSEPTQEEADSGNDRAEQDSALSKYFLVPSIKESAEHENKSEPPNWVEVWTLRILVLTLTAAGWAAFESHRLANLTNQALQDARDSAREAQLANDRTENLTADALGIAQAANRQAREASGTQESLTRESNGITRQAFVANTRPYIGVKDVIQTHDNIFDWRFRPLIENAGNTPGMSVEIANWIEGMAIVTTKQGTVDYVADPADPLTLKQKPSRVTLGPHSELPSYFRGMGLSQETLDKMSDGTLSPFIYYGYIRYRDALPKSAPHITKFCFDIESDVDTNGKAIPVVRTCRHWNCVDRQCDEDKRQYEADTRAALAKWRKEGSVVR